MVCGSRGAVKPLTETVSSKDRAQFLQEAAILHQFDHENVVKLHGVVTDGCVLYRSMCQMETQAVYYCN